MAIAEDKNFSDEQTDKFKEYRAITDWEIVLYVNDPNVAYCNFHTIFNVNFEKYSQIITKNIKVKSFEKTF